MTSSKKLRQFLIFSLGREQYAIDILKVQEIKGRSAITRIPNAPLHVRGVMNLRGAIVPIVDLRARLGMPPAEVDGVIVVVMVGKKIMGLVVDAVSDVLSVAENEIDPTPDLGDQVDTSFMLGIAKTDQLVALLDIDALIQQQVSHEVVL